jgi:hypothetical protein
MKQNPHFRSFLYENSLAQPAGPFAMQLPARPGSLGRVP